MDGGLFDSASPAIPWQRFAFEAPRRVKMWVLIPSPLSIKTLVDECNYILNFDDWIEEFDMDQAHRVATALLQIISAPQTTELKP